MPRRDDRLPAFMSTQVAEARRFYVPADLQAGGLAVASGGWERCDPDYRIDRTGFMHLTLELVVEGRGGLWMSGRRFDLERGVLFAYGPGVPHAIETDPDERLSKYFVNLTGTETASAMRDAGVEPGEVLVLDGAEDAQAVFDQLVSAGQRGTGHAVRIAALQARILMLLASEVRIPEGQRSSSARRTFQRCREYVETHFLNLRTVEEAAVACGVSLPYFSRIFRRFTGQAAYPFLMRLKMGQAAALLEHHGFNVSETADALGLDPFHFSRAFKRVHGRAPSSFMPGA